VLEVLAAEVLMLDGTMEITTPSIDNEFGLDVWTIAIERQVFYLVKIGGQWYIKEWFDFGTS